MCTNKKLHWAEERTVSQQISWSRKSGTKWHYQEPQSSTSLGPQLCKRWPPNSKLMRKMTNKSKQIRELVLSSRSDWGGGGMMFEREWYTVFLMGSRWITSSDGRWVNCCWWRSSFSSPVAVVRLVPLGPYPGVGNVPNYLIRTPKAIADFSNHSNVYFY